MVRLQGLGFLSLVLAAVAVAVVYFHSTSVELKSADRQISAQYDSSLGRGVLNAERDVDALFVQLSEAQTHLNQLTNKVLEGAPVAKKSSHPAGTIQLKQTKHAEHVEEALDKSIAQARANVDRLSAALRDAEEQLNTRVSFIVDTHPAGSKKDAVKASTTQGPPLALAHSARASQLLQKAPRVTVAASGDKSGFPSHAAERRNVRAAYNKFYILKAAKQANIAKEAAQGWDVTPYKDCKGTDCNIELYLNLKTPNVDYTARTGKHFLPSMAKLRRTVTERGRLALKYGKVVGIIGNGPRGEALVDPQGADPAYHFVWQRPGVEHSEIGGAKTGGKSSGQLNTAGAYAKQLPKPAPRFDEPPTGMNRGALADKSKMVAIKKLVTNLKDTSGGASGKAAKVAAGQMTENMQLLEHALSGREVVPAVVQLAKEQTALLGLAKKIEDAADNRQRAAQKEDKLVHETLSRLMGTTAAPAASHTLQQHQQQQQQQQQHARAMASARQPGSQQAIQTAAMTMGRSFLSFLPPKLAEQDMNLFATRTDPALEPILQAAGAAASPFEVPGDSNKAEKPVIGNTLTALNGRVAQLEGSLEQSLGLLVSVYVCVCACLCECVCVRVCKWTHIYIYIHTYIYICMYTPHITHNYTQTQALLEQCLKCWLCVSLSHLSSLFLYVYTQIIHINLTQTRALLEQCLERWLCVSLSNASPLFLDVYIQIMHICIIR